MALTIFGKEQLEAAIDKLLPDLPEGHTNAIAAAIDSEGAKIGFTIHLNELGGVDAKGYGAHYWNGNNVVGAQILHSW